MNALRSVEMVHSHSPVVLMENYQMKIANLPNKINNSIEKNYFEKYKLKFYFYFSLHFKNLILKLPASQSS